MTTDPWRPPDWRVEVPTLWTPPRQPRSWRRGDSAAVLVTTLMIAMLGAPVGLLWSATSAHLDIAAVVNSGSEEAFGAQFGGDAHFFIIGAVMGVLTAVVAVAFGRRHGPGVVVGLAVGGLLAGIVAARIGYLARHDGLLAELHRLDVPASAASLVAFKLRATGAVVVWPIVAVAVFAVATLVHWVEPEQRVAVPAAAGRPADGPGAWPPGGLHGRDPHGAGHAGPPPPS